VNPLVELRDRIVAGYRDSGMAEQPGSPAWLEPLRSAAIDRFHDLGFPTRKREDWKYTNVANVADFLTKDFDHSRPESVADHGEKPIADDGELDTSTLEHALVFVNGRCDLERSHTGALPDGAVVDSLARVLRERPEIAEPALSRTDDLGDRAFVALNTAFQRDGALVLIPSGGVVENPIHLIFISTEGAEASVDHPLILVRIGELAAATVVARHVSIGNAAYTKNVVSDIELAKGANLQHVGLELESDSAFHLATLDARIGRDAHFTSHSISLGAALARLEIRAVLAGTGAECTLNGLYIASGDRHVDNQTLVDHAEPHGTSRELYKGILADHAKGVFNGTVIVRPDAQKTSAEQSNPNLLLSGNAEVDTRPNLEIHADDVKCTHGSTVGCIDDDAMFFLRARGISEQYARQMLSHAFASEVIDRIPDEPLRDHIRRQVEAALLTAERETR
jgi:Fe-S cluster assembly protein SufD